MQDIFSEFFEGYTEVCDMEGGYAYPQRFSGKLKKFFEEIKFRRCNCSAGIVIRANKCKKICFDYKTFDGLGFAEFDVLNKSTHKTEHYHLSKTEGTFEIITNEDNIEIYLGYQNIFAFKNFIIDAESARPHENTILCYGDSITHGYCSQYSVDIFPAVLSRNFDAEVYNFGIGGIHSKKEVLDDILSYKKPMFITYEYGTNDWHYEKDTKADISFLFKKFNDIYPDVPIFIILPLPRRTQNEVKAYGNLAEFRAWIANEAAKFDNLHVLDYFNDFDPSIHFVNDGIHPNNDGEHILSSYILRDIKCFFRKD